MSSGFHFCIEHIFSVSNCKDPHNDGYYGIPETTKKYIYFIYLVVFIIFRSDEIKTNLF